MPFFRKPRVDDRGVLSAIVFIIPSGLRWCDAPRETGPAQDPLPSLEVVG